jgi:hypothetical protein
MPVTARRLQPEQRAPAQRQPLSLTKKITKKRISPFPLPQGKTPYYGFFIRPEKHRVAVSINKVIMAWRTEKAVKTNKSAKALD